MKGIGIGRDGDTDHLRVERDRAGEKPGHGNRVKNRSSSQFQSLGWLLQSPRVLSASMKKTFVAWVKPKPAQLGTALIYVGVVDLILGHTQFECLIDPPHSMYFPSNSHPIWMVLEKDSCFAITWTVWVLPAAVDVGRFLHNMPLFAPFAV